MCSDSNLSENRQIRVPLLHSLTIWSSGSASALYIDGVNNLKRLVPLALAGICPFPVFEILAGVHVD